MCVCPNCPVVFVSRVSCCVCVLSVLLCVCPKCPVVFKCPVVCVCPKCPVVFVS